MFLCLLTTASEPSFLSPTLKENYLTAEETQAEELDVKCASGEDIPIEQRSPEEVTHVNRRRISAEVEAINPAFDVTPGENIECLVTEVGIFRKPYAESLAALKGKNQ